MDARTTSALLYLDGINVSFDGFKALNNLSFVVKPGEMRAIIGPNGAGKTTMMDVVTGKTRPDTGDAVFDGSYDLTALDETEIAELGIGRKFQKPTVFDSHTVEDNLRLALKSDRRARATLWWQESAAEASRVNRILEIIRLPTVRGRLAGSLAHGQKQWLEIGMLLAQEPKLLLAARQVAAAPPQHAAEHREQREHVVGNRAVPSPERRVAGLEILLDGEQRKDVAALRHIGDAAARPLIGPQRRDIGAFPPDRAGRHRMLADERAQQAGLADAVAAEHAGHLAGLGVQRDGAQRLGGAVIKVDRSGVEHGQRPR